jgi:hypothetical protein
MMYGNRMTRRVLLSLLPLAFWKRPTVRTMADPAWTEYERRKAARIQWLLHTEEGRARLAFCVNKFDRVGQLK